jgi:chemotaxis methyl-accepting protein methylase/uncharacterized protein with PIN domain
MLKRLARWLRAAGLDVEWQEEPEPPARVLLRTRKENRVLLTRTRRGVPLGERRVMILESEDLVDQLAEVFRVYGSPSPGLRFTRCTLCNVLLQPLDIEKARPRLPETVRDWCGEVWTCPECSRLYWEGSHVGSMERLLGDALERARGRTTPVATHIMSQRHTETAVARSWDRYDAFLRRLFGEHDRAWSGYRKKRRSLRSKFLSRMGELGLATLDEYTDHVKSHPQEKGRLNEILSITVSRFFRDREEWTRLTKRFGDLGQGGKVRAWSLGCASGEEPFTLRILWEEWCETARNQCSLEIYASDVSSVCLRRARAGLYPEGAVHSIPEALRQKYFQPRPGSLFELDSRIRASVEFARLDFLEDPWPEGPFDLVMCRNVVFMYLEGETRQRIGLKIVECLRAGGILMVGSDEGRHVPGLGLRSREGCLWEKPRM